MALNISWLQITIILAGNTLFQKRDYDSQSRFYPARLILYLCPWMSKPSRRALFFFLNTLPYRLGLANLISLYNVFELPIAPWYVAIKWSLFTYLENKPFEIVKSGLSSWRYDCRFESDKKALVLLSRSYDNNGMHDTTTNVTFGLL